MPLIQETLVTTTDGAGVPHLAPLGLIKDENHWIIAPFHTSRTLDNLRAQPRAVASLRQDEIDQMTAGRMSPDHNPLNALLDDEPA